MAIPLPLTKKQLTEVVECYAAALTDWQTIGGNSPVSMEQATRLWAYTSEQFASGALGRAAVFFDNPSPGASMFVNIEAPILWNRGVLLDFQPSTYSYPGPWDLSAAGNYH